MYHNAHNHILLLLCMHMVMYIYLSGEFKTMCEHSDRGH